MAEKRTPYSDWSPESLIERIELLEKQLKERTDKYKASTSFPKPPSPPRRPRNARVNREFDPSKYSTRFIALKVAYLGQKYSGLEYHANNNTSLPTVEEILWKALNKARLIFPTPNPLKQHDEVNWDGCEYSKCGRTDRGVSAFGQVIGIRVRSNRPVHQDQSGSTRDEDAADRPVDDASELGGSEVESQILEAGSANSSTLSSSIDSVVEGAPFFGPVNDEIPYPQVLNRLLPSDIRVLAWCPSPPAGFSARFACKERQYKYFFTQPAFAPSIGPHGLRDDPAGHSGSSRRRREGWLNIQAMREAAKKFEGLHDFRNFCKLDSSKQIENFDRRIFHADIEELDPQNGPVGYVGWPGFEEYEDTRDGQTMGGSPKSELDTPRIFTFTLYGSAFLWHQVRHMVAILFLIGQGLESPGLVDELLDVRKNPMKPQYEMADDAPLVLWDCIFPREGSESREDALEWMYVGDDTGCENGISRASSANGDGKYGSGGIVDETWKIWRQSKIDEVLAGTLLDVIVSQGKHQGQEGQAQPVPRHRVSQKVFAGGNGPRLAGKYTPVLQRPRMESVEVINARYAKRKDPENVDKVVGSETFPVE